MGGFDQKHYHILHPSRCEKVERNFILAKCQFFFSILLMKSRDSKEAQKLADFVLFSQRSCVLRLSPELTKGKLNYPQFFLLAYLAEEEGLSMSNIAKMMGHSTAAATGMIDKLQELGYIHRSTAAADRRKVLVRITDKGLNIVQQMRNNLVEDIAGMLAQGNSHESMPHKQNVLNNQNSISKK